MHHTCTINPASVVVPLGPFLFLGIWEFSQTKPNSCTIGQISKMHHESELTRDKTQEERQTPLDFDDEEQSRESSTSSDDQASDGDVVLVNFQPGDAADPHNWSKVLLTTPQTGGYILMMNGSRQRNCMPSLWARCYPSIRPWDPRRHQTRFQLFKKSSMYQTGLRLYFLRRHTLWDSCWDHSYLHL